MIKNIANKTNCYAGQKENKKKIGEKKDHEWNIATMEEIYIFLGLTLLMAHVKKNRMQDYWAVDEFLATPIFGALMPRNRYFQLWTYLHFTNNLEHTSSSSRLYKIEPIVRKLQTRFKSVFHSYQNFCMDESLMLF